VCGHEGIQVRLDDDKPHAWAATTHNASRIMRKKTQTSHCDSLLRQCSCGDHWVRGHEGRQVRLDADGAHAWAATTVWDAEGLVQVQVAHVSANVAGAGQAHLQGKTQAETQETIISGSHIKWL
jgi:hypothetical protein